MSRLFAVHSLVPMCVLGAALACGYRPQGVEQGAGTGWRSMVAGTTLRASCG